MAQTELRKSNIIICKHAVCTMCKQNECIYILDISVKYPVKTLIFRIFNDKRCHTSNVRRKHIT